MKAPTSFHSINGSVMGTPPTPIQTDISTSYEKMTEVQYRSYLNAHNAWYRTCFSPKSVQLIPGGPTLDSIQVSEHKRALTRRFLEDFREVPSDPGTINEATVNIQIPGYTTGNPTTTAHVKFAPERKMAHAPVVSTQPHQAEKRSEKKKLRDSRVKRQVEVIKARTAVVETDTAPVVQGRMLEVKAITDLAPLHKKELAAAKSAAARAKQIKFGSTDLATNIDPGSWKVVTRKKGADDAIVPTSYTIETHHDGASGHPSDWTSWQTSQDPALPHVRKNLSVNPRPRNTAGKA